MARRVTLPDGGTVYELDEAPGQPRRRGPAPACTRLVTTVDDARRDGGGAHAARRRAGGGRGHRRLPARRTCSARIAGDDTIFIVPDRGRETGAREARSAHACGRKEVAS